MRTQDVLKQAFKDGLLSESEARKQGVSRQRIEVWKRKEPTAAEIKADLLAGLTYAEINKKYGQPDRHTARFMAANPALLAEVQRIK